MSIYATSTLISPPSTIVDITLSNTLLSSSFCSIKIIGVDVVTYDISYFKGNYNNQFFENGKTNAISATNPTVYTFTLPINPRAFFIGHSGYYAFKGDVDFTFGYASASVGITLVSNPAVASQILDFSYIEFETIPICASPGRWNQASNQCQACSLGYYYDTGILSCVSCSTVNSYCLDCTDSTTCTSCDYSLTPSGSNC